MSESNPYIPPIFPGVNTLLEGEYRSAAPFEVPDWKPFLGPFSYADGEMDAKNVTVHPPEQPTP